LRNVSRTFASVIVYLFSSVRFDFLTIYVIEINFGAAASCCSFFFVKLFSFALLVRVLKLPFLRFFRWLLTAIAVGPKNH